MGQFKNNKFLNLGQLYRDWGTTSLDDYMYMRQFFINIGYDTSQNIHKQFCKKYNIEYDNKDRVQEE